MYRFSHELIRALRISEIRRRYAELRERWREKMEAERIRLYCIGI